MKNLLLIIGGGIAAYKAPQVIRLLQKQSVQVTSILTKGGKKFITPLTISGVSGQPVYENLFSPKDESEMGHIRLSREADAILICPATADLLSKMAHGSADDLASATLLAADKPIYVAPAMNVRMWEHAAVQENIRLLKSRGVHFIGPTEGDMACGEYGVGHLSEPEDIVKTLTKGAKTASVKSGSALAGKRALVTAGPTYEALDAVRFIGNYSSGKQGYAMAEALRAQGAEVILVSGSCALPTPAGVSVKHVQSAADMLAACEAALPCDIAICAAAVADWCVVGAKKQKLKKRQGEESPLGSLQLQETPDILQSLATRKKQRPKIVIGFAAESHDLKNYAKGKLQSKKCDVILANNIASGKAVFGSDENALLWLDKNKEKQYKRMAKTALAEVVVADLISFMRRRKLL